MQTFWGHPQQCVWFDLEARKPFQLCLCLVS